MIHQIRASPHMDYHIINKMSTAAAAAAKLVNPAAAQNVMLPPAMYKSNAMHHMPWINGWAMMPCTATIVGLCLHASKVSRNFNNHEISENTMLKYLYYQIGWRCCGGFTINNNFVLTSVAYI